MPTLFFRLVLCGRRLHGLPFGRPGAMNPLLVGLEN